MVDARLTSPDELMVLGPRFIGDGVGNIQHQLFIPAVGDSDRLRKDGGIAGTGDTVQCLVPPVVFRDAETRYGGGGIE